MSLIVYFTIEIKQATIMPKSIIAIGILILLKRFPALREPYRLSPHIF